MSTTKKAPPRTPAGWMIGSTYCEAGDVCPRCDCDAVGRDGPHRECSECGATWGQLHRNGKVIGYDPGPRAQ
jgi:hypothetical protein